MACLLILSMLARPNSVVFIHGVVEGIKIDCVSNNEQDGWGDNEATNHERVDTATTTCVEKQSVCLLAGAISAGIAGFSSNNYPVVLHPECMASMDETDISMEGCTRKVVCRVGGSPKSSSGVSFPTVKISAVLGSKANGEPLAPVLINKVG